MQFDTRSLWIYLYFPQLQLDLLQASEAPPVAIVNTRCNALCQINPAALQQGVKLGMGLASASLIYPNLRLHEYKEKIETQALTNIAKQLYLFTSDIALIPPKGIALRAQNMLTLYGGLNNYWEVIKHSLAAQHIHFIAAGAYSVQAAKLLAVSGKAIISESRECIDKKLLTCPLSLSEIDPKDLHKLARIGIKNYADLMQLALPEIANRVSRCSMSVINELAGKQATQVKFYQPTHTYYDYIELLYEINISGNLEPVLASCLHKLSEFLRLRNAHCLSINMMFYQREHDPIKHTFNSLRAIYKSSDWLDIIALQLDAISFASPVYGISISCPQYEIASIANDDMFSQKSTHLASLSLLSRLQSKLGQANIHQIQFVADFRPEISTKKAPFHTVTQAHKPHTVFADRPGLLLSQPQRLQTQVQVIKGPERIQTGWWDDKPINRDYYIAQSQEGQQLWIFKTPNKEWYLHGYFI